MKINVDEFLLKAILDYWNTPEDEEPVYTEFTQERDEDYMEHLNIERIDVDYSEQDDVCIFDVSYNHTIESLDPKLTRNNTDVKAEYIVHMYYLLKMSPFPNSKIDKNVFKFYTNIKKLFTVYYNDYDYRSFNKRYLIKTNNYHANRHRDDIFDTYNINKGKEYEEEISDLNLIFSKYEKDIIENDRYGEYDSLLIENLANIISDYEEDIYEICGKSFIVYLGKNKEEFVYADIKTVYLDDPVCEEERIDGYHIDFEIEVLDKKYIITYNYHTMYEIDDCITKVSRLLDKDKKESIYISTFLHELHELEDSLSEQESDLNYTAI